MATAVKKNTNIVLPRNLVELLINRSDRFQNKVLYNFMGSNASLEHCKRVSFEDLDKKSKTISVGLLDLINSGDRVVILLPPGENYITSLFGCLYAGIIAVPVQIPRREQQFSKLIHIINDCHAKLLISDTSTLLKIKENLSSHFTLSKPQWFNCDEVGDDNHIFWKYPKINEHDTALIQYSSGTTGTSKGSMITHDNLLHNLDLVYQAFQHNTDSRVVSWLPPYHDMGLIGCILQPLYAGMTSVIMPPITFIKHPFSWLKTISDFRATTSGAPNFAYDLCTQKISDEQKQQLDLSCWEVAFIGAETIRKNTIENFTACFVSTGFQKRAFLPCYGLAEATLFVAGNSKGEGPKYKPTPKSDEYYLSNDLVSCGHLNQGQNIRIVNPNTLLPVVKGEIGEIWVNSRSVAKGYWNKADLTNNVFHAHASKLPHLSYLRTGDLGMIENDQLYVVGRIKELITHHGKNLFPQEIEHTITRNHSILEANTCVAFSIDSHQSEQLVIVIEIHKKILDNQNIDDLVASIKRCINEVYDLDVFSIVFTKPRKIPKTSSGKMQRHLCRKIYLDKTLPVIKSYEKDLSDHTDTAKMKNLNNVVRLKPKTYQELENYFMALMMDQLRVTKEQIDLTRPIPEYGMDSSLAIGITCKLEKTFHVSLEPTLFWEYPTFQSVINFILNQIKNNQNNAIS